MKNNATEEQVQTLIQEIEKMGYRGIPMPGAQRTAVCIIGNKGPVEDTQLLALDGVKETITVTKPYKLVSRETHVESTVITIGDVKIGTTEPVIMAGPCAVESEEQALTIAHCVKEAGAKVFRGGAFKPRTSPYSFQGLGEKGLYKKFPELTERDMSLEDIFNICESKFKEHVVYARVIQNRSDLEKNYKIMDLDNPMIDENDEKYLNKVAKSDTPPYLPEQFVAFYHQDKLGGMIRNVEFWVKEIFEKLVTKK